MINQSQITFFIFEVNAVLDTGRYNFSFKEIREQVQNKNIISFLKEKCGNDIDLSLYSDENKTKIENALSNVAEGLDGRERRKTGIENNGLCLLIAYLVEMIQTDYDTE